MKKTHSHYYKVKKDCPLLKETVFSPPTAGVGRPAPADFERTTI